MSEEPYHSNTVQGLILFVLVMEGVVRGVMYPVTICFCGSSRIRISSFGGIGA
jgi:hypothetical protein